MSNGTLNKVIIIGNLGQEPELKYFQNGDAYCNVNIATTESWKDRNTGEQQERVEWNRVVFFRKLAEIVGQYLHKGSKVFVEGKLQTRKWQGQDGQDRYSTEIIADEMLMLDGRPDAPPPPPPQPPESQKKVRIDDSHRPQHRQPQMQKGQEIDGDIPF